MSAETLFLKSRNTNTGTTTVPKPKMHNPQLSNSSQFDGIICIGGEDWWYHNRGHFDFQIMRRLAKQWPVLFVNSIGVRIPSIQDKRVFAQKIARKLTSLSRGVTNVENQFWVYSPLAIPGKTGLTLSNWASSTQIKLAARRIGIKRPLVWVHCPAGVDLVDPLNPIMTVLQRTDRFESFPEGDPDLLSDQIKRLKQRADLAIYAAPHLMEEERGSVRDSLLVTHGVDLQNFISAGDDSTTKPEDIKALDEEWRIKNPNQPPPKRVGFIGGLDAHTFDPDLFNKIAKILPNLQFVLVGGSSLPKDWCTLNNVAMLGRKPYDQIAGYMAAMDVLIMPWNNSEWIKACNPIKLKEYLAVGRPVVTRDFEALEPWRQFVTVATDAQGFAASIEDALNNPPDPAHARAAVASESWDAKAQTVATALVKVANELKASNGQNLTDSTNLDSAA